MHLCIIQVAGAQADRNRLEESRKAAGGRQPSRALYIVSAPIVARVLLGSTDPVPQWSHSGLRLLLVPDMESKGVGAGRIATYACKMPQKEQERSHTRLSWNCFNELEIFTCAIISLWCGRKTTMRPLRPPFEAGPHTASRDDAGATFVNLVALGVSQNFGPTRALANISRTTAIVNT